METARAGARYIDRSGRVLQTGPDSHELTPPVFDSVVPFRSESGGWGYADERGRIVIPPIFDAAFPFREGKAVVVRNDLWWYIAKP